MSITRCTFIAGVLLFSACGSEPASQVYLNRLSSVLDVSGYEERVSQPAPLHFPRQRELTPTARTSTLSLREFLGLRECQLHGLVAQKNSLLGKLAETSQALFNDLAILEHGPACLEILRANQRASLATKLAVELDKKSQLLPELLWRALLGESENRSFWSNTQIPPNYPAEISHDALPAIHKLIQFSSLVRERKYRAAGDMASVVEASLSSLAQGDAGHLMSELTTLASNLAAANWVIEQRLDRPLCLTGSAAGAAWYFKNVVNKFFIHGVQQRAVSLRRRHQQLLPVYQQLEEPLLQYATPAYRTWAEQRDQRVEQGLAATKQHVLLIQRLYSQCGLQAG